MNYIAENNYDFSITYVKFIVKRELNPHWKIDDVVHDDCSLIGLCTGGKAFYNVDGKESTFNKDDIVYFSKGCVHSGKSSIEEPLSFFSIALDLEYKNDSKKLFTDSEYMILPSMGSLVPYFNELYMTWMSKKPGYLIKCYSIIMNIIYSLIRETESHSTNSSSYKNIENVIEIINTNYMKSYSLEELSVMACLSPSHFRYLFKKITGMSANQYQNHVKVNIARDLLVSKSCNVTEAAQAVGFKDVYYFSRLFTKITGMNPSKFI